MDVSVPWQRWILVVTVVLPWLWPFAWGPWSGALPWLVSLSTACVLVLLGIRWRLGPTAVVPVAWLVAACASSAIGLLQYFGVAAALHPWVNTAAMGEAFANLRQRNQFATLTNIGQAVLVWWSVCQVRRNALRAATADVFRGQFSGAGQSAGLFAAVLLAAACAATSSRTGLLQLVMLAAMCAVWGRLRQPEPRRMVLLAGVAYGIATVVLPQLAGLDPAVAGMLARLRGADAPCFSRLVLWRNVLELIAQKPWLGWGWGELDYAHFITLYPGPRFCDILDNAHNLPLHLAVELGLPVAILVSGLGLWLIVRARPWRETDAERQMAWAVLALILAHSMLEYPLWYGPFQIAVGLCCWILWSTRALEGTRPRPVEPPMGASARRATSAAPAAAVTACAVLVLAGVAYAAWDYRRVSQIYTAVELRAPEYREDTLKKIQGSWLFRNQVRFAELSTTTVTAGNAAAMHVLASELLHFSPEARVVEKLITSAVLLGRQDEAAFYLVRFRAAFPSDYARWIAAPPVPLPPLAQ